ncbi:MAG: antitoxin [Gammaproteobacteria bacterium]|nr:MAG: antitoxin [Gammaproteobacteria bacterium]
MQSKLTLRLDDSLINQAKIFAEQHDKSLSQVVSDYFELLTKGIESPEAPAITKSLIGVLGGADVTLDDYKRHLEEKYL